MYFADVTSMKELEFLLSEAECWLMDSPDSEQARWDVEDIKERMEQVRLDGSATP
jgi:hypothetical protein